MSLPLEGLKVLAFEQYGAGPFGSQYLSDLGAEVIKIEPAGTDGDYLRALGPYFIDEERNSASSIFFQALNRNKKSITLNILSDEGKEILGKLVKESDAVCNNLRGDVPEKLGITFDQLKQFNKKIVAAHCSAYGREGSRKNWPGYDYLMQAEAGYFSLTGEPSAPPARFGLSIVDYMAGLTMAFSLVSGVLSARSSGIGRDIDVSLFDTAMFNQSYVAAWALNSDYQPERLDRSAHPVLVPCQLYKTADGWIYLMCNKESFWPTLCDYIDRKDLGIDKRFSNFKLRQENRDLITDILDKELSKKSTSEWLEIFAGNVPAAPILDIKSSLENEFVKERNNIQKIITKNNKKLSLLKTPIRFDTENHVDKTAPELGEHNEEILNKLGYSNEDIKLLKNKDIV
ncbi:MAG: CoA transferase [SAR116 cluster bacterium]|nr:CoA transferase [SAR116 cluster bacterium]RPH08755.1 MAG: CoA transferase [Alphaproteobacteria bacterium TMED54]|tara:strand:- start:602 stop:1804 length:1203 start_codon:yes stop_codon:yes gene_type:complete